MGTSCTVCIHKDRPVIELGLVHRVPVRILAKRFNLSTTSVHRHRRNHMPAQLRAALLLATKPTEIDLDELRKREGEGLLASLIQQRARLSMLSEMCFQAAELHAAVAVERAVTGSLELTSKLIGMLVTRHSVTHTNILISADYITLRSAIMSALRKHPEAARDVAHALAALEQSAAQEIVDSEKPLLLEAHPT